jgi:hypothetical protein
MTKVVTRIHRRADDIRQGAWRGGVQDALFFSDGKHVVVTGPSGEFITVLKNGAGTNSWFLKATRLYD